MKKKLKYCLIAATAIILIALIITSLFCERIFFSQRICVPLICNLTSTEYASENGYTDDGEPIIWINEITHCKPILNLE